MSRSNIPFFLQCVDKIEGLLGYARPLMARPHRFHTPVIPVAIGVLRKFAKPWQRSISTLLTLPGHARLSCSRQNLQVQMRMQSAS